MAICVTANCGKLTKGKSKYCAEHAAIARAKWIEMISSGNEEKQRRQDELKELFARAHEAGVEAANKTVPIPMIVTEHASPIDDSSPAVKQWYVPQGVCGFAWIKIRLGNCPAANYAKKHLNAQKSYCGGVDIWVYEFGQSYELKVAYAHAFAEVLRGDGIDAWGDGRLD